MQGTMLLQLPKALATLALLTLLAACGNAHAPAAPIHGDRVQPGEVQVAGLTYCAAARLELVAVVLGEPPQGDSLDQVKDAQAPGCTWAAVEGGSRVRLNVYPATGDADRDFNARALAHARRFGQGQKLEDIGVQAARFGYNEAHPHDGVLLVQARGNILEYEARDVPALKLQIFVRSVTQSIENGYAEG